VLYLFGKWSVAGFLAFEEDSLKADLTRSLAIPESRWSQRPVLLTREDSFRAILSKWSLPKPKQPIEFRHEFTDGTHTITINRSVSAGRFLVGKKEVSLGDVPIRSSLLVPPGEVTRIVFTEAAEAYRLYLSPVLLAECHEHIFGDPASSDIVLSNVTFLDDKPIRHLVHAIMEISEEDCPANRLVFESVSLAIASRCVSLNLRRPVKKARVAPLANWRLQRVTEYIHAHLFDPIYLADLSNIAGLTRMHFLTQFRLATGFTPNAYVMRMKIEHGRRLLAETDLSIVDISQMLGFKSQSHFTLVFRKIVGNTPARWRTASK
jgi:AraC family transcriptional regulator